ncbi:hypothetical protein IAT40_004639 [Kwoniella sp. CBS 6097]
MKPSTITDTMNSNFKLKSGETDPFADFVNIFSTNMSKQKAVKQTCPQAPPTSKATTLSSSSSSGSERNSLHTSITSWATEAIESADKSHNSPTTSKGEKWKDEANDPVVSAKGLQARKPLLKVAEAVNGTNSAVSQVVESEEDDWWALDEQLMNEEPPSIKLHNALNPWIPFMGSRRGSKAKATGATQGVWKKDKVEGRDDEPVSTSASNPLPSVRSRRRRNRQVQDQDPESEDEIEEVDNGPVWEDDHQGPMTKNPMGTASKRATQRKPVEKPTMGQRDRTDQTRDRQEGREKQKERKKTGGRRAGDDN